MKNLIKVLSAALNKDGNRTTPNGTCIIHCPKEAIPMKATPATFSIADEEVGTYKWGGDVRFSDWPYHEGQLSHENGEPVVLTCDKNGIQYKVKIIARSKGTTFGDTVMPFWAVFEAVNRDEADQVHNVYCVIPRLKTEYIKELEEKLEKYES